VARHCSTDQLVVPAESEQETRAMTTLVHVDEPCLTVADVAERLKIKHDTVRRLFMNEPGVIVIRFPRKGKRLYRTLRIPASVFQRVVTRLTHLA
jgi:hypothetical protein